MTTELAEKIDRDSVGFIVHEKYEEIVRYLQDALQSSLEDENNFKEKADEIQEMVILLSNSKADRTEIANMQEIMVKSEALLKKIGNQGNMKEKIKDFISKKEVEALLANKVDRMEFEEQLHSAVNNSRRSRKLASLSTSLPVPNDRALGTPSTDLANLLAGNSMVQDQRQSSPSDGSKRNLGRPVSGQLNTQVLHIDPPAPGSQNQVQYQPIPVIAIGQSIGSPHRKSPDFGTYLKLKGPKKGANGTGLVGSASATNIGSTEPLPGAFRKASEGGRPGGTVITHKAPNNNNDRPKSANIEGYGASEYPYTDPNYAMNYTDQSKMTDHLAYLHGPIAGGGYNVKNSHLQKGNVAGKPVANDDVEGKGL